MIDVVSRCWRYLLLVMLILMPLSVHAEGTKFPLRVAENRRYLEDATGKPFLITGEAAWSLIGDLSREDADKYLADRQRRGFNTLLVSLIEHRFSRNAPRNFYKRAPFLVEGDFTKPNESYFNDADWILNRARERGFLVLLVPSYLGSGGGPEGWFREVQAAGPEAMRTYGRYLGERFRKYPNIVWVQGGDYDTPDKSLVDELARGISDIDPSALQTVHRGPDTLGSMEWAGAPWLKLDTLYAYDDIIDRALQHASTGPEIPFFFIEGPYENERGSDERSLRLNAYGTILSGACGQIFGNNPLWHFAGPGLYDVAGTWEDALASRGSQSITHLKRLFDTLPWWKLEPERGRLLAKRGQSSKGNALGALTREGTLAVLYLSGQRSVAVDTNALAKSIRRARWYDPASGNYMDEPEAGAIGQQGIVTFEVPRSANSGGFEDWVLVLTKRG
ncbi:DUF4038 domain-containing protein [Phyllobacterium endophyticum]|uniref:apiosidase-like domain-containing protein n=1 Tax=Phyllobacterium endophyticum TaxID=1149773 RepID=UPI0011CB4F54|nr:DUF4038 domain-containing protein [Phyllobacterium endophyticum]TXR48333.1 DUF4038 domain-containing protein [Phyllobacterium endophyticum]